MDHCFDTKAMRLIEDGAVGRAEMDAQIIDWTKFN
jgi:hypothetical protein